MCVCGVVLKGERRAVCKQHTTWGSGVYSYRNTICGTEQHMEEMGGVGKVKVHSRDGGIPLEFEPLTVSTVLFI